MEKRLGQIVRFGLFLLGLTVLALLPPLQARSAPFAAMVMDARTGEVLYARNADTRLHPASLTKMMTLYIAFEAIRKGEISLDTVVTVSRKAANEPPSKLGLKPGQKIKLRYLIRAAAVKSANDAATAIAEAISGSEAAFARRMNRTAKALGMTRTTFKNANGLTEPGHLSTARDMTVLGRRLLYDYPEYYNLFSRRTTNAGIRQVSNTNRRFLDSYPGADGIKTGYTRAAGFNLVASAVRGNKRIIATVFGGLSTAARNKKVAELLDLGFRRAPDKAPVRRPPLPVYADAGPIMNREGPLRSSVRPAPRPGDLVPRPADEAVLLAMSEEINKAVEAAAQAVGATASEPPAPPPSPAEMILASLRSGNTIEPDIQQPVVVTRVSTSGGRNWGINVGRFSTRYEAERVLLKTALIEMATLDEALRKVVRGPRGFEANFVGLTEEMSALACRRLQARDLPCTPFGPS